MTVSAHSCETALHTKADAHLAEVIAKAVAGGSLIEDDALSFLSAGPDATKEICAAAAFMRDQGKGNIVTFSPKVFIPLTHLCRDFCGYCTFRQAPSESKTLYLTPDEILSVVKEGEKLGRALYFSRANIPAGNGPRYHHIGLYAYRRKALDQFIRWPRGILEDYENLEQLRVLENGLQIGVALVDTVPLGVDTLEDLILARKILKTIS